MEKYNKKTIINKIRYEFILWYMWFFKNIPGQLGCLVRRLFIGNINKNSNIWDNVTIDYPSRLTVGHNSSINRGCVLNCAGEIIIGNNVLIGPNTIIYSQNHNYKNKNTLINKQGYFLDKVIIKDNVWIAANVIILPGVIIEKGSIIGAGSIVTKNTKPYSIYVGKSAELKKEY